MISFTDHASEKPATELTSPFIRMIAYKEEESGGQLIQMDAKGTTQMCSGCGEPCRKTCPRESTLAHTVGWYWTETITRRSTSS